MGQTKKYVLFDHDGVLVDTEHWYYKAGERALAEVGVVLDHDQYLLDMSAGAGTWAQARAAGIDDHTVDEGSWLPGSGSACGQCELKLLWRTGWHSATRAGADRPGTHTLESCCARLSRRNSER